MSSTVSDLAEQNVRELNNVVAALDELELQRFAESIASAPRVFFAGSGRSLLALKAVAMRLMHIGLEVHVAGEVTTPGIARGDLLVIASARGGAAALASIKTARSESATVGAITTTSDGFAESADVSLVLPVRHGVETAQHAGSLFEQSLLVVGDALCAYLQLHRAAPTSALDARHANL